MEDMQREEYHQQIRDHLRMAYLLSDEKIEQVMPKFIATLASLMHDLEKFSATGDFKALNDAGHAMKGALLNLGLRQVADIALSIEKFSPSETDATVLAGRLSELRKELQKII